MRYQDLMAAFVLSSLGCSSGTTPPSGDNTNRVPVAGGTVPAVPNNLPRQNAVALKGFFTRADIPLSGWNASRAENRRGAWIVFLDSKGYSTSEIDIRHGRIKAALLQAKTSKEGNQVQLTAASVRTRFEHIFGAISRLGRTKVSIWKKRSGEIPKWMIGREAIRIVVTESPTRGQQAEFDRKTGQLLSYNRWP